MFYYKRDFKKLLTISIFIFVFLLFFFVSDPVLAVTKVSGDLELSYSPDPLFSSDIIWYPGLLKTRYFTVKNNDSQTHKIIINAQDEQETGGLSQVMFFEVLKGSNSLYGQSETKTINNFWNDGDVQLTDVNAGQQTEYTLKVSFWQGAGNEYQNKDLGFNILISFEGTDDEVVVEVDDGDDDDDDGDGDDGGGDDSGDGTGGPTVTPPGVILSTFPFRGGFFGAGAGDVEEVVEDEDEDEGEVGGVETGKKEEPEVKGETTCEWWYYLWWLPLVFQSLLTSAYYYWIKDKARQFDFWWIFPIGLAVLSQLIHNLLGCECVRSSLCPYYWLFNLVILIFTSLGYWKIKED